MRRFFYPLVTLLVALLLTIILLRYFSLFGVAPDLFLLLALAFGFSYGPLLGQLMGFFGGFLADALGVRLFGLHILLYTLMGYLAGKLARRLDSERSAPQMVIALMATLLVEGFGYIFRIWLEAGTFDFPLGIFILQAFYNSVGAILVFWALDLWAALWRIERAND